MRKTVRFLNRDIKRAPDREASERNIVKRGVLR